MKPHRGATLLVLAILGAALCFPIGLCCALSAVVMAIADLRSMKAGRMDPTGHSQTVAALVIAIGAIGLTILLFLLWCVYVFMAGVAGSSVRGFGR